MTAYLVGRVKARGLVFFHVRTRLQLVAGVIVYLRVGLLCFICERSRQPVSRYRDPTLVRTLLLPVAHKRIRTALFPLPF